MGRNPLLDLLAALLPAPEREALIRRSDADPALCSLLLGLIELFWGARVLLANAFATYDALTAGMAGYLVDKVDPHQLNSFDAKLAVFWSGSLVWLAWLLRPKTWLLISLPAVGVARLIAFAISRESIGEPLVWLGLRAAGLVRRAGQAAGERRHFGPERPDRLLREPGCDLLVLSCRPKPEWNELVTIAVGDRFYRVRGVDERPDRGFHAHAYRLHEAGQNEVLRGLLHYQPPGPLPPGLPPPQTAGSATKD